MIDNREEIEKNIALCEKAEKELLEPVEPFLPYWEIVQATKKQMRAISRQKKFLRKKLEELSTSQLDTQKQGE